MSTVFDFGRYKGHTLAQVVSADISYVFWCIRAHDHFYVSKDTLTEVNRQRRGFRLTVKQRTEMEASLATKEANFVRRAEEYNRWRERNQNDIDGSNETFNQAKWYDDLGDDEIETAYWNLD